VVGFYLYIKNEVIANFGFLDPEFGVGYEEENDLIFRANKVGYSAILVDNAFAYHAGSASFSRLEMNLKDHKPVHVPLESLSTMLWNPCPSSAGIITQLYIDQNPSETPSQVNLFD